MARLFESWLMPTQDLLVFRISINYKTWRMTINSIFLFIHVYFFQDLIVNGVSLDCQFLVEILIRSHNAIRIM